MQENDFAPRNNAGAEDPWNQKEPRDSWSAQPSAPQPAAAATAPPPSVPQGQQAAPQGGYSPQLPGTEGGDSYLTQIQAQLAQVDKSVGGARAFAIFVAVVNVALGGVLLFLPDVLDMGYDAASGVGMMLFGILYFGLAIGISYRSRICTLAGLIIMVLDTLLSIVGGNIRGAVSIMRILMFIALIGGVGAAFRYHKLRRQYAIDANPQVAALFQPAGKKLGGTNLFCIIAGALSVVLLVVGVALSSGGLAFGAPKDPKAIMDSWEARPMTGTGLTVRAPADAQINTSASAYLLMEGGDPAQLYMSAVCYPGVWETVGEADRQQLLEQLCSSFAGGLLERTGKPTYGSNSTLGSYVQYTGAMAESEGSAATLRAFGAGKDCYVLIFAMAGDTSDRQFQNLSTEFFSSVQVK